MLPLPRQILVYGFILFYASKVISNGSEMLLSVYGPGPCARTAAAAAAITRLTPNSHTYSCAQALLAACLFQCSVRACGAAARSRVRH